MAEKYLKVSDFVAYILDNRDNQDKHLCCNSLRKKEKSLENLFFLKSSHGYSKKFR